MTGFWGPPKTYPPPDRVLNAYEAVGLAEGFIEPDDEEHVLEAWQYLIDGGLAWQLQGFFGRTAASLIEQGLCTAPAQGGDLTC